MLIPAIWTGMYAELPLPEALRTLHANDWRCFEMSSEHLVWLDRCEDSQARIAESLRTIDTLQITMPQAHAKLVADVAQPDLEKRRIDIEEVERHITICAQLGVKCVVVHPGFAEGFTNEQEKRQLLAINKDSFTRLADHAGSLGLKIGIENGLGMTMRNGAARLAADAEGLIELVKTIDHPAIGVTIDTSHGNVNTGDVPGTVRQLGSLICCTHISDNDRSGDQHRTPGNGTINWQDVVAAFREIGYQGIYNLEIPGERHANLNMRWLKTRHAREVTEWLVAEMNGVPIQLPGMAQANPV